MILAKQLEELEAKLYRVIYPELMASKFVPSKVGGDKGARTFTYRMLDRVGSAKLITNYATDLPSVGAMMSEHEVKAESLGAKYEWSIQDIRNAAMAGVALTTELADIARLVIATKVDDMLAFGEPSALIYGLLNHPNVTLFSPLTGSWSISTTAAQLLADVKTLINGVNNAAKGSPFKVNTVAMTEIQMQLLTQTRLTATGDGTLTTVMNMLRNLFPGITFDSWDKLDTADVAGTGPRMMAYHKNPVVCEAQIVIPFEALPPQAINLAFEVPCHARMSGIKMRYPFACGYMDGC
jgi:hypothetical protein